MAKKKDYAGLVVERFRQNQQRRSEMEDSWIEYEKKYHLQKDRTEEEMEDIKLGIKSDIKMPRELSYIETKKPRVINAIFSQNPIVRVIPDKEGKFNAAKNNEIMLEFYFKNYLYLPFYYALDQCLKLGTGIIALNWLFKKDEDNLIDRPNFERIDLFNFYIPETYLDIQKAPYVVRKVLKPVSHLEKLAEKGIYKNIDKIKENSYERVAQDSDRLAERLDIIGITGAKGTGLEGDSKLKYVELLEHWEDDRIVTVANRDVVVRDEKNEMGFKPFFAIKDYPQDTVFYGKGEIEILADIPQYTEDVKNLRMDILKRVAHPAALVSRKARIPREDLVTRPFQVIRTNDMDGYKEVQRPDIKRSIYDEESVAKGDAEDVTSIYSYLKGGYAPRGETAYTTAEMKESGNERINSMVLYNCKNFLKQISEKTTKLTLKKLDKKQWFRYSKAGRDKYVEMNRDDIESIFTYEASAFQIRSLSDVTLQQNFMGMYDRLAQSGGANMFELNRLMLDTFDVKNKDELLIKNEEVEFVEMIRENPEMGDTLKQILENPEILQQTMKLMQQQQAQQQGGQQQGGPPGPPGQQPLTPEQKAMMKMQGNYPEPKEPEAKKPRL